MVTPAKPAKAAAKKSAKKAAPRKAASAKKPAPRAVPGGHGVRGRRLWEAHREQVEGERGLVMLEEAARIADRLDKLALLLSGDEEVWAYLVHDVRTEDYELRIDSALIEARQQANVLRQLVAGLPLKESDDSDADDPDAWVTDVSS
jgi:hypothetical protein